MYKNYKTYLDYVNQFDNELNSFPRILKKYYGLDVIDKPESFKKYMILFKYKGNKIYHNFPDGIVEYVRMKLKGNPQIELTRFLKNPLKTFTSIVSHYRTITTNDIDRLFSEYIPYININKNTSQNNREFLKIVFGNDEESNRYYMEVVRPKNPYTNHGGKLSPYSKKYVAYKGLSEKEKEKAIDKTYDKVQKSREEHPENQPTHIEYYLAQGMSQDEAKEALKKRQTVFSLELCIEKHGEKEGTKIWKDKQVRWQKTLMSKSPEEIERINRAKFTHNLVTKGYSKISQELFSKIYKDIKGKYKHVFYAELNHEFFVMMDERCAFLDFYIKDINVCIEFDGDYWHGEKRGNQERNEKREESILKHNPSMKILHVKERDYRQNETGTIEHCLDFINEHSKNHTTKVC